jgi:alpha-L-fucosidase 2
MDLSEYVPNSFTRHDLVFNQPVDRWDEAIPLGNGMMGILIWGDGQPLKLSLDRADLWDARPVEEWKSPDYNYRTMRQWVKEGRIKDLHRLYEDPYSHNAGPTKIPAGRIQIKFPNTPKVRSSRLSLEKAMGTVNFDNGTTIEVFQHAQEPVGFLKIHHMVEKPDIKLVAPAFGGDDKVKKDYHALDAGDLARLNYPAPQKSGTKNSHSFEQEGWDGFRFAITIVWQETADGGLECAWSISTTNETDDPLALSKRRAQEALKIGFKDFLNTHMIWWSEFWRQARISVPDSVIERQWYLDTYKFGSAARRGAPPITLQAVWTADEGKIPPWRGDYHHDLNTQLSYWPCYSGNHLQEGLGYLDWLWETLPEARLYTQKFFGKPGVNVPMTADINGKQIGGWHQYTHSATTSAWLAHHFYLHWRYSMDRDFLKNRAYPYLNEVAVFLEAITEKNDQGIRYLPLSASPEIFDNKLEAWLPPTSNYDLALMRWLFSATAECAAELNLEDESGHWLSIEEEFPDFSLSTEDGRLLVAPNLSLPFSHRHFSHLMAIHPLGLFQWENGSKDQQIIQGALNELDRLGSDYWTGYSFSWLASLAARAKDGERAQKALDIFSRAFCSPNSFHLNGDQTKSGYSKFTYRPFTLEGNMAAASGLQEMLLQSYGGIIRIFPAIPKSWNDVGFYQLRAEGAFIVSALKKSGHVIKIEIVSEKGGKLVIENPFGPDPFKIKLIDCVPISENDWIYIFECQPGGKVIFMGG